jgi:16S rRNA (adenine1518-N6/adenine1519-N6)-dimethyltransferase
LGRRLGQHFLASSRILEKIAEAACPEREKLVIEIGPGKGALTEHLLPRVDRLIAVELDPALAADLETRFAGRAEIVSGDALTVDFSRWGPAVFTGNLPYYVATPIIERLLGPESPLTRGIFLVQKEVADRLGAVPGTRAYGFLSVRTQLFAEVKQLSVVRPSAFRPPPKVDSQVVRLIPHVRARDLGIDDPSAFLRFVSLCFHQKRKTIRNNIAPQWPGIAGRPEASLRAEQMPLEQFASLFHFLTKA